MFFILGSRLLYSAVKIITWSRKKEKSYVVLSTMMYSEDDNIKVSKMKPHNFPTRQIDIIVR
jgi:hypothetical protein